ncbi:GON7 [Candida margitis]|uniref:GON7 n=1 Tax=Candida margitis TaxID=1775924 RepID=UPI002226A2B5|nr:GON7 [Candida margitis]KAI5949683.1 GON7 [Candida margitis]
MLSPTATYTSDGFTQEFHPGDGPHTTDGSTTQISDIVLNAGGEDRDKPSAPNDTPMGELRAALTTLQDQINVFLTDRMRAEKENDTDDIERKVLDEGVEEDSESE